MYSVPAVPAVDVIMCDIPRLITLAHVFWARTCAVRHEVFAVAAGQVTTGVGWTVLGSWLGESSNVGASRVQVAAIIMIILVILIATIIVLLAIIIIVLESF